MEQRVRQTKKTPVKKTTNLPPARATRTMGKTVKKSAPKKRVNVRQLAEAKFRAVKTTFKNIVNKTKRPRKKVKKLTKTQRELNKQQRNRGILGIGLLLVVVSIGYSTSVIFDGVDSIQSRIALLPQVVFAVLTLFKAFSKLYK